MYQNVPCTTGCTTENAIYISTYITPIIHSSSSQRYEPCLAYLRLKNEVTPVRACRKRSSAVSTKNMIRPLAFNPRRVDSTVVRGAARRWKGGGGASSGGGGLGRGRRSSGFEPRPGYRLCNVCNIGNHRFTVRENKPIGQREVWYQDAPVGCEIEGLMCEEAKLYKTRQLGLGLVVGSFFACLFGYAEWNNRNAAAPVQAMRDSSKVAVENMRQWCDGDEDRNETVSSPPYTWVEANLISGEWTATYTEGHDQGRSIYTLKLAASRHNNEVDESMKTIFFNGTGKDYDGPFRVEHGRFNTATRRIAWGERSRNSSLYTRCHMKCANATCTELEGHYRATSGAHGELRMVRTTRGRQQDWLRSKYKRATQSWTLQL